VNLRSASLATFEFPPVALNRLRTLGRFPRSSWTLRAKEFKVLHSLRLLRLLKNKEIMRVICEWISVPIH